jgi:pyridinium-3,5-biscarboxylic acid mononucleotide sulfurtransferase
LSGGTEAEAPLDRLLAALARFESLAIAVSGGADSMTLAHVAHARSRCRPTMYHATGPAVPAQARTRVEAHARAHGWPLVVLDAGEMRDPRYRANPLDRCYYCKSNLYDRIREATDAPIASGTNRDDLADFRPGLLAAGERTIVHPFVEAGIDKAGVYAIARELGLADLAALPAQPCLASRVETGIAVEADDLGFIDAVETALRRELGEASVLRCRVTHRGVVVEVGDDAPAARALAERLASDACARSGRAFAGVRRYVRGAAFIGRPS